MRNPERWTPSKYVLRNGRLSASHDAAEVGIGSRLIAGAVAARYAQHLAQYARGRLIDLGCGKVPLYGAYRERVSEVVCIDWPASAHGGLHVDLEADLGCPLPFADAAFDTIVLSDVLEHLPQPELMWREMARLLAPGGHALVNVPFMYGVHEAPHDYYRFTGFGLQRLAQQAGLEVRVLETLGGSQHVLADFLAKHLAHVPLIGVALAIGVQGVVGTLDRTPWGRRLAQRSGERFPLGYFVVAAQRGAAGISSP